MPNLHIVTEHAADILTRRLMDHGFSAKADTENHLVRVEWHEDNLIVLADVLLSFIMTDWSCAYLSRRVGLLHDYLTDDEREYVALLTYHALRRGEEWIGGSTWNEWRNLLLNAVHALLAQGQLSQSVFHIDGLMRFRARDLLAAADDVIAEVAEQFLADREYEEFVSMLRYMLETQTLSDQVLHVFCTNDQVWITDASGNLVRDPVVAEAARQVTDDGPVNAEDLAMSILITRAPAKIVIHDLTVAAPWPSFAETAERVFMGRSSRCRDCPLCRQLAHAPEPAPRTEAENGTSRHSSAMPDS